MTALGYMEMQARKHRRNLARETERGVPEEMLEAIRRKAGFYEMAVEALRERDALMAEIKDMCFLRRHYNSGKGNELCECCDDEDNFEWRGAQDNRLESDTDKVVDSDQFENKPLEYLEVFDMRGEPVWIVWPDGRIKDRWWIVGSHEWNVMDFDDNLSAKDYGKVWVAYRRKPETGWVSVEKRLPEDSLIDKPILICKKNRWNEQSVDVVHWRGIERMGRIVWLWDDVTHWMPLPEPPEVGV